MWSGAWNKAHFRNLLTNTYQASPVSIALEWWSRGLGSKPIGDNFWLNLFCSFPCNINFWQICQISLSWKTWISRSNVATLDFYLFQFITSFLYLCIAWIDLKIPNIQIFPFHCCYSKKPSRFTGKSCSLASFQMKTRFNMDRDVQYPLS